MEQLNEALERIKILECPTGEVENRIRAILEDYNIANKNDIEIFTNNQSDHDGEEIFNAIINGKNLSITVLAKSGMDGYVSKIESAFVS